MAPPRGDAGASGPAEGLEQATPLGMPSPQLLAAYRTVYEELPQGMWLEVRHTMQHQRQLENAASRRMDIGQWLRLVIALAVLGVAAWLISGGHEVAGTILGSVDIV